MGGPTPELVAWIRLVADDEPPDELRMITLIDALAPSYAAVMTAPAPGAHHGDHGPPRCRARLGVVTVGARKSGHPQREY